MWAARVRPSVRIRRRSERRSVYQSHLQTLDVIVTCQGGDYTNEIYPQLRAAGWNGYWIDAASTLRMKDDAVIILDPVNRHVIQEALSEA